MNTNAPLDKELANCPYFAGTGTNGIRFYLHSRVRFIPYAWLLHAETNRDQTELTFYYTHCTVTVRGETLLALLEEVQEYRLEFLHEMLPQDHPSHCRAKVQRVDIVEKE